MGISRCRALRTLALLSWASLLIGCEYAHKVNVPPSSLPAFVQEYRSTSHATVDDDERRTTEVTTSSEPQLEIRCRNWPEESRLRAPLGSVSVSAEGRVLEFPAGGNTRVPVPQEYVEQAAILLTAYPSGWRHTVGVGGAAGGAAGAGALTLHVLPKDWIALEVGAVPLLPAYMAGYAAFRVRPLGDRFVSPFAGGFINGATLPSGKDASSTDYAGAGPRVGVDISSPRTRIIVTLEVDLVHPLPGSNGYFGLDGQWLPWGGMEIAYFF